MDASIVVVLLVLALPGSRAEITVMVNLGSNTRSFAIIPDEVNKLVVSSVHSSLNVSRIDDKEDLQGLIIVQNVECEASTSCNITLNNTLSTVPSILEVVVNFEFSTMNGGQNLSLTVRQSLNAACATYIAPQNFTKDKMFVLNCQPLRIGEINITDVRWRKFREYDKLLDFQRDGTTSNTIIQTSGAFVVEGSMNATLKVMSSRPADVAYYFVPSFVVDASGKELVTAETVIYVEPRINTEKPEFSFEVTFNSGSAQEFNKIRCETTSFPSAEVVWILNSENYVSQNVANITTGRFTLENSGSLDNVTRTFNAIIKMTDLQYDDDGNFTCIAKNIYSSSAQWAILRVKSPLRPLWPALGILGVVLSVTIFMSGGVMVEKLVERQKRSRISESESNSSGDAHEHGLKMSSIPPSRPLAHNSTKESSNSSGKKRLSSTKPLLEETTANL